MTELIRYEGQEIEMQVMNDMLLVGGHYKPDVEQYIAFCNRFGLPVGFTSLSEFRDELLKQRYKGATINKKLAGIRSTVHKVAQQYLNVKEVQILKQALQEVKGVKLN